MSETEYVTMRTAQEMLGVSGPKMWRLVRDGDLVAFQDPLDKRRKLLRVSDVEALKRKRPPATPEQEDTTP